MDEQSEWSLSDDEDMKSVYEESADERTLKSLKQSVQIHLIMLCYLDFITRTLYEMHDRTALGNWTFLRQLGRSRLTPIESLRRTCVKLENEMSELRIRSGLHEPTICPACRITSRQIQIIKIVHVIFLTLLAYMIIAGIIFFIFK